MSPADPPQHIAEDGEPALLGAAATLPVERKKREKRRNRKGSGASAPKRSERRLRATTPPRDDTSSSGAPPDYSGVEHVFEPHASTIPPLRPYLRSVWERRRFMKEMAVSQIRGKRSSTALGSIWGILDPLFQAAIYFLLFTIIRGEDGRPIGFLHVLIAGIFLFQMASASLSEGGGSIRQSTNLMLNSDFPRAILPIATVYKGVLKFLPTVGVYIVIHLVLQAPIGLGLVLFPLLFSLQLVLMAGVAMFTATLVVYFRDAQNLIQYVTRILFFTSPVIYPLDAIPEGLRDVLVWQPFFALFASYQRIFDGEMPSGSLILQAAAWAFGFLIVGSWAFLRHERDFASHL